MIQDDALIDFLGVSQHLPPGLNPSLSMALDLAGLWCVKMCTFVFMGSIDSSFSCDVSVWFLYWVTVTLETELGILLLCLQKEFVKDWC